MSWGFLYSLLLWMWNFTPSEIYWPVMTKLPLRYSGRRYQLQTDTVVAELQTSLHSPKHQQDRRQPYPTLHRQGNPCPKPNLTLNVSERGQISHPSAETRNASLSLSLSLALWKTEDKAALPTLLNGENPRKDQFCIQWEWCLEKSKYPETLQM